MAVGAGLRACPIKILFLKVKIRIAALAGGNYMLGKFVCVGFRSFQDEGAAS
jgi:hypothetical protein